MGELNRQQHTELEGAFSADPFFNGFILSLGGLFLPAKGEGQGGNHFPQFVNFADSINRRLTNAFPGYVYKDSADTDSQFSVKPFTLQVRGLLAAYAGQTARGPLVTGVNRIWADLSAAPTVTIAFGANWPTITPHLKLAEIDMPASGSWLPEDLAPVAAYQAALPYGTQKGQIRKAFTYQSGATFSLGFVAADSRVIAAHTIVDTAWNGTAPTLKIGDGSDDDRLSVVGDQDLKVIGKYNLTKQHKYSAQTELIATMVIDGSTAGAGEIILDVR